MLYKVLPNLATHGLDLSVGKSLPDNWIKIDCRKLKELDDPEANPLVRYFMLIEDVWFWMKQGRSVCLCCSGGVSRSNAIAVGYLTYKGMDFRDALSKVQDKVPICQIDNIHIDNLKLLFGIE
jgi:hypothetical protein